MVGATSGIGAAMADRLVQEGSKVIAVGRRQDRLDEFVRRHGKDKTSAVRFDISDRQTMDQFVSKLVGSCS
jgi:NADP-dependent 3-hydroxy acid dehydrogenase YdfG